MREDPPVNEPATTTGPAPRGSAGEVFRAFLKLGLTSFGGPIAHLGFFRDELVTRRRWVRESEYADLVALGQFLPGPASSQVGFALGLFRAGPLGALAAWIAFTLPSAILLVAFAYGATLFDNAIGAGVLAGLKVVAVAIVAQAVWGMARTLTPDARRASIAVVAAILVLFVAGPVGQVGAIVLGALAGYLLCRDAPAGLPTSAPVRKPASPTAAEPAEAEDSPATGLATDSTARRAEGPAGSGALRIPVSRRAGVVALSLFAALLVALPAAAAALGTPPSTSSAANAGNGSVTSAANTSAAGTTSPGSTAPSSTAPGSTAIHVADSFYRAGALVFGGGHVVLPLLQSEVVTGNPAGWVTPDAFLAGYGAAQAVPGPLFTFAAYLGALAEPGPAGLVTAAIALVAVFLPGLLLLVGVLPFWNTFRTKRPAQAIMRGANAAVVGILAAALYDPVFVTAIVDPATFALALVCFALLVSWRTPPWVVVLVGAAGGALLAA
ncbi:chromate transporter [Leucobacter sp. W1038]|uniref:chromate transporter n=1 Tax=Leucobacter sp. W1038 TaxID=3438281 RepID=UPI003D9A09CC